MPEFKANLEIPFADFKTAKAARDSLIQETEFTKKSTASLKLEKNTLIISISAGDYASLRATIHSYSRLLAVFYGAKETVETE